MGCHFLCDAINLAYKTTALPGKNDHTLKTTEFLLTWQKDEWVISISDKYGISTG